MDPRVDQSAQKCLCSGAALVVKFAKYDGRLHRTVMDATWLRDLRRDPANAAKYVTRAKDIDQFAGCVDAVE